MDTVFTCEKCTYQTQRGDLWNRHCTRHSTDRPFECTLCDYSVVDHATFVEHLAFHQQSKIIQCPFCPHESSTSNMTLHLLKHRALEMFDCSFCEFSSNNIKSLNRHVQAYHDQKFKCEYCTERMTKYSLIRHWDEVHGIKEVSTDIPKEPDVQWEVLPCLKPGSTCTMLPHHIIPKSEDAGTGDDFPMGDEAQGVNLAGSKTDDFNHDEVETYSCHVCEFSSHLKVLLKYHVLSMHTKKVACKHCSALMTKHALIQHSKNAHGKYMYFDGKGLREDNFQSKERKDSQAPPVGLSGTETPVRNPRELGNAKIVQSGDRFLCSVCKYSTLQKKFLQQHIDNLHRRKYLCNNCPAIMTKFALIEHARQMHGVSLKVKNRYIVEAKSEGLIGSGLEEECHLGLEVEPERAYDHSQSTQVDIGRTIVQKGGQFFCTICKYSSSWRPQLETHTEKLHMKKYHCKHCPEVMNKYDLIEHSMAMHGVTMSIKTPGLKEFRQELDEGSRVKEPQQQYMDDHELRDTEFDSNRPSGAVASDVTGGGSSEKPFTCSICGFKTHREWSLTCHMKFLHTLKFHCNHCPEIMTKHDIIKHSWDKHGVEIRSRGPSGLREAKEGSVSQGDTHKVPISEVPFGEHHFMGHFMDETKNDSPPDMQIDASNPATCSICGFACKYPSALSVHMDLMHRRKFCCSYCPEVMSKHELVDHSWSAHGITIKSNNSTLKEIVQQPNDSDDELNNFDNDDPKWEPSTSSFQDKSVPKTTCLHCNYVARSSDKIRTHVERMHSRKFHCEHCTVVMTKYDLIRHYAQEHGHVLGDAYRCYQFKRADGFANGKIRQGGTSTHDEESPIVKPPESGNQAIGTDLNQESTPGTSKFLNENVSRASRRGCSFCEYSSVVPKDVINHEERMHNRKYHCEHCKVVMVKYDLLQHYRSKHGIMLPNNYRFKEAADVFEQGVEQMDTIQLDEEYSNFQKSSSQQNKKRCMICGYLGPESRMGVHMDRLHTMKFQCRYCTVITNKYELIKHYKSAHGCAVSRFGNFIHYRDAVVSQASTLGDGSISSSVPKSETPDVSQSGQMDEDMLESIASEEDNFDPEETSSLGSNVGKNECSICGYGAFHVSHLQVHVERMHRKKFRCNHCPVVMTKHELVLHCKNAHDIAISKYGKTRFVEIGHPLENQNSSGDLHTFSVKSEDFEAEDRGSSPIRTGSENIKCVFCDFSTKSELGLELHTEKWHRRKYICNSCPEIMSKHDMIEHSKNVHGIILPKRGRSISILKPAEEDSSGLEIGDSPQTNPNFTVDSTGQIFKCNVCDYSSNHRKSMVHHVISMHSMKYSCNHCSAVMTKHELIVHSRNAHKIIIPWNGRGYVFKQVNQDNVNTHSKISYSPNLPIAKPENVELPWIKLVQADGTSRYQCTKCKFASLYPFNVKAHAVSYHSKLFRCDTCSAIMTKCDLIRHYENAHDVVFSNNQSAVRGPRFKEYLPGRELTETEHSGSTSAEHIPTASDRHESELIDSVSSHSRSAEPLKPSEQADDPDQFIAPEGSSEKFNCSMCDFSSKYRQALGPHFERLHKKKFSCGTCSAVMTRYELIKHYENVHGVTILNNGRGYSFKEVDEETAQLSHDTDDESEFFRSSGTCPPSVINPVISYDDASVPGDSFSIKRNGVEYVCSSCGFSSESKHNVQTHLDALHRKKYGCKHCSAVMPKYDLIRHYNDVHEIVIQYLGRGNVKELFRDVTLVSDRLGSSSYAESRSDAFSGDDRLNSSEIDGDGSNMTRVGGEYKCNLCDYSSVWRRDMKLHCQGLHKRKYSCNRCNVILTKYELVQHYEASHNVVVTTRSRKYFKEIDHSAGVINESAGGFADDVADSSVKGSGPTMGSSSAPAVDDDDEQSMTIIQEGGEFKCSICGFSTAHRFNLKSHFEAFHQKKYSCNRCSFVSTKYGIVTHYETIHRFVIPNYGKGNIRPYCTAVAEYSEIQDLSDFAEGIVDTAVDDSLATESGNIAANMVETVMFDGDERGIVEIIVEGGKFKCSICGFSSAYRGNARAHVDALHQKKFSCNRCSVIKTKYDMIQHYETAHDVAIPHMGKGSRDVYYKAVGGVSEGIDTSAFADDMRHGHWINEFNADEEKLTIIQEGDEFKCSICGYAGPKSSVKAHIAVLHKKKYSCNCCSVVLTKYEMINHYKTDHDILISSKGHSLKYFKEIDQGPEAQDSSVISENSLDYSIMSSACMTESKHPDEGSAIIKEGDIFKCSKCPYSSNKKENARSHLDSHHVKMYSCNQCSAVMTRYQMLRHYETDHEVIIPTRGVSEGSLGHYFQAVNQAPKVTENLSSERAPEMEHSASNTQTGDDIVLMFKDGKEFRCGVCNHSFLTKPRLEKHFASLHEKKFSCNRCSVVMTKYNMIQHFKLDHGIKIPYNGRGLLSHYFTVVNQDSDVADRSVSDSDPAPEKASHAAIENPSDVSKAVGHQKDVKCPDCDFSTKCIEDLKTHCETLHGLERVKSPKITPADGESTGSGESGLSTLSLATNEVPDGSLSCNDVPAQSSLDPVTRGCTTFKCPLCNFSSRLRMHLQVHTKTMHSSAHSCKLCSKVLSEHELLSHYRNVHRTTMPNREAGERFNEDDVSDLEDFSQECIIVDQPGPSRACAMDLSDCQNRFKCAKCEFSTDVEHSLTSHIEALHYKKYQCNTCPAIMTKHELFCHSKNLHGVNIHVRSYTFREAKVDFDYSKEYDVVSDADAMVARRTFSCPTCDFSTKAKWYLKDHIGKFHIGKYPCPHCSVVMTRFDLTKHCKNIHGITYSTRQFMKLFPSTVSGPTEEMSVESNEEPGKDVLGKVERSRGDFSTPKKWSLNEYMENVHRKKFSCRQCPAVMTKPELRKHSMEKHGFNLKINRRFFADENQAKFRYKKTSEFKKPKRFPCDSCTFSSFHAYGLKRHMKLHHTIKYPCQHCATVMTRYDLIKHCQNVHNTRIQGNPPGIPNSDVNVHSIEPSTQPTGGDVHFSMQGSTSQVVDPKGQAQLPTALTNTAQFPTVLPLVVLEKLPIDVDDLESTFSVIDNTKPSDSSMVENSKFPSKPI